jgi:hypothetical protein
VLVSGGHTLQLECGSTFMPASRATIAALATLQFGSNVFTFRHSFEHGRHVLASAHASHA